jgi:hypothetical protein
VRLKLILIAAVALLISGLAWQIYRLEKQVVDQKITIDSTTAENDALQKVNDSTWTRLAVVQKKVKDLEGELSKKPKTVIKTVVAVDTVRDSTVTEGAAEPTSEGYPRARGRLDRTPFHVDAEVELHPGASHWSWQASLDPMPISFQVDCDPTARVTAQVPTWAEIQTLETRSTPNVCPERYQVKKSWLLKSLEIPWWTLPAGILGGYLYGKAKN